MERKPNRAMIGLLALIGEIGFTEFGGDAFEEELLGSTRVELGAERSPGLFGINPNNGEQPQRRGRRKSQPAAPEATPEPAAQAE